MVVLYVDMDGTVADIHSEEEWRNRYLTEKGFFRNLKPFLNMIEGIRLFHENNPEIPIRVLSSAKDHLTGWDVTDEKDEWADYFLPFVQRNDRIYVESGSLKEPVSKNHIGILLDDFSSNLHQWCGKGGVGIKCKNNVNCKNGTWKGDKISVHDDAVQIASQLENVVRFCSFAAQHTY